jgi:hypothetical protein
LLGVPWPLRRGWKERLLGKMISGECARKFLDMKDKHTKEN